MSTKKVSSQKDKLDAANLHHAYALVGNRSLILPAVLTAIEKDLSIGLGNPDLLVLEFESLTIDDARNIRSRTSTKPSGDRRVVVICAHALNHEAQNALLKTFEDPGQGIHFFIIIPSVHILLPTLRSRLSFDLHDFFGGADSDGNLPALKLAQEFISMSPRERLEWVKDFTDDLKDEKRNREEGIALLCGLQKIAAEKFPLTADQKQSAKNSLIHKEILSAISFSRDTSSSIKMILEHIALTLNI